MDNANKTGTERQITDESLRRYEIGSVGGRTPFEREKKSILAVTVGEIKRINNVLSANVEKIKDRPVRRNYVYEELHREIEVNGKKSTAAKEIARLAGLLARHDHYLFKYFAEKDESIIRKFLQYAKNRDNAETIIPLERLMELDEEVIDAKFRLGLEISNRGTIDNVAFCKAIAENLEEMLAGDRRDEVVKAIQDRAGSILDLYRNFPKEFEKKYGDPKQGEIFKSLGGDRAVEIMEELSRGEVKPELIREILLVPKPAAGGEGGEEDGGSQEPQKDGETPEDPDEDRLAYYINLLQEFPDIRQNPERLGELITEIEHDVAAGKIKNVEEAKRLREDLIAIQRQVRAEHKRREFLEEKMSDEEKVLLMVRERLQAVKQNARAILDNPKTPEELREIARQELNDANKKLSLSAGELIAEYASEYGLGDKTQAERARDEFEEILQEIRNTVGQVTDSEGKSVGFLTKEYFDNLTSEQREKYMGTAINRIRNILARLEETRDSGWHIHGLTTEERVLNFLLTNIVYTARLYAPEASFRVSTDYDSNGNIVASENATFKDTYERINSEISGRQWLHNANLLYERSSPSDVEGLIRGIMQLRELREVSAIFSIPEMGASMRGLEEIGVDLMRFEGREDKENELINPIEEKVDRRLGAEKNTRKNLWAFGLTGSATVNISRRIMRVFGREGEWYRKYIDTFQGVRYNEEIDAKYDLDNNMAIVVNADGSYSQEKINITWDPFRALYSPHIMWKTFTVGSDVEGSDEVFLLRKTDGTFEEVLMPAGRGLGEIAREVIYKAGFDFGLSDWFSRRMDHYIKPAWIEQVRVENPELWDRWQRIKQEEGKKAMKEEQDRMFEERFFGGKRREYKYSQRFYGWVEQHKQKNTPLWQRWQSLSEDQREKVQLEDFKRTFGENVPLFRSHFVAIEDLSDFRFELIPWEYLPRQEELVRANHRDHGAAMSVMGSIFGFLEKPSIEAFLAMHGGSAYQSPSKAQARMWRPLMEAIRKIHKGKLPFGYSLGPIGESPAEEVYGWESFTEKDMTDVEMAAIKKGLLPVRRVDLGKVLETVKNAFTKKGTTLDEKWEEIQPELKRAILDLNFWMRRNAFHFIDIEIYTILLLGLASAQLNQLQEEIATS